MAASSTMLDLGTPMPSFSLPDVTRGTPFDAASLSGSISVVAIICNHCPYVKHIAQGLSAFGKYCAGCGVKVIAVSSNDVTTHPEDGPTEMAEEARRQGYEFPYLFDETQDVARAFRAACTPEFYVWDRAGKLAYRGRFDESSPRNGAPVTGNDVRAAVDALLAGKAPGDDQKASIGCSIKWKAGGEPDYAR